ncbi:MAG TPA: phage baseplate assembly protein V, partial [Polyangiaceae bacterium]|nr:phage baseplate assembly protein V [Polyangiaceae bacterium]
ADSRLLRSRLALLQGKITMPGRVDIAPLDLVELGGIGDRFNGSALVSAVTDRLDQAGWRTELSLGLSSDWFARRPEIAEVAAGGLLPAVHGLCLGVVADFESDPAGEQRVKVLLSGVAPAQGPLWARVARPDAGDGRGMVYWPEPGDEVTVGFVAGDPRQPIILGTLYGSKNAPPKLVGGPTRENEQRAIVSKSGLVIAFDDKKKAVRIETPGKNTIIVDDDAKAISLSDQHGNELKLDSTGITLKSHKDFTIDASSGKVSIKASSVEVQ